MLKIYEKMCYLHSFLSLALFLRYDVFQKISQSKKKCRFLYLFENIEFFAKKYSKRLLLKVV